MVDFTQSAGDFKVSDTLDMNASNDVLLSGGSMQVSSAEIDASNGFTMQNNMQVSGDSIDIAAQQVALNGGNIKAQTQNNNGELKVVAGATYAQNGTAINADSADIKAGAGIELLKGSLTAKEAALSITVSGNISEAANGFVLDVDALSATVINGNIALDSKSNRLVNVNVYTNVGDITIGSANGKDAQALTVTTGSDVVKGALSITNYSDGSGSLNEIKVAGKLQTTGAISIVNNESDINVAQGSEITSSASNVRMCLLLV